MNQGASSLSGLLTQERLLQLRNQYLSLVQLEVEEFGVKPTEVRHLIGRLGEFECALLVGGTLSHIANQHGFDVVAANGRKISVKATSQKSGFVAISKSTLHHADDLMVIQYRNAKLEVLYYGCINKAVEFARFYTPTGSYELELSKARQLQHAAQQSIQPDGPAPGGSAG
ncbi:MAG: hypothetical protein KA914_08065 [Ottowia sp.]|nr:hypothetical protein [Ottowia sp.]